jgi:cytosine/adenosine deaminase-related metal-dependent hydrolase
LLDLDDVLRVRDEWVEPAGDMLGIGMNVRSPSRVPKQIYQTEWDFARQHGIPMTFHCSGKRTDTKRWADLIAMDRDGLMGPDVQVVHAVHANDQEIRMLAGTGTHVSVCPVTQIRSMGAAPPITDLIHQGVVVSLSIDNLANPTPGDMFLQMRGTYSIESLRRPDTFVNPRRLLQLATLDGARDLGFDDVTGSVTPGKRADILVIDTNSVNLVPCPDPISQVVLTAQSSNIEHVIADGRHLVERGAFLHLDEADVIRTARQSQKYLLEASAWHWPHWSVGA